MWSQETIMGEVSYEASSGVTYTIVVAGEPSAPYHYGGDYPNCETRQDMPEEYRLEDICPTPHGEDEAEVMRYFNDVLDASDIVWEGEV